MPVSRVHAMLAIAVVGAAGLYVGLALVHEPGCVEIADHDPARFSPAGARYSTGGFTLERQRGVSRCNIQDGRGQGGRVECLLSDPGRFRVTTKGERRTYSAPLLAKIRISSDGRSISCAPAKAI